MPTSCVYVVDDEILVLQSLAHLLTDAGFTVKTFTSAKAFLDQVPTDARGCVILDLVMVDENGLDVQTHLAGHGYHMPILFLSGRADTLDAVTAMKAGAVDFLTKPVDIIRLLATVKKALELDQTRRDAYTKRQQMQAQLTRLTPRERQILHEVVLGYPNKLIAANLGRSEKTIKIHRSRIKQKLGTTSVIELVRFVWQTEQSHRIGDHPAPHTHSMENAG